MSGLNSGPQYRRLDLLRAGEIPLEVAGCEREFAANGFAWSAEAKSRNILLLRLAIGCWLYHASPFRREMRDELEVFARMLFADEAVGFMGDEPGSTTYQPHHLNALYSVLDALEEHPELTWIDAAARECLGRHLLWCSLYATPTGEVLCPGRRCGEAWSPARDDWYTGAPQPAEKNWRRMRVYEWRRTRAWQKREPLAGATTLRTLDTFRLIRGENGHLATMAPRPTRHGHPPPIWAVRALYDGSAPLVWREGEPHADDALALGAIHAVITIDSEGVHRA